MSLQPLSFSHLDEVLVFANRLQALNLATLITNADGSSQLVVSDFALADQQFLLAQDGALYFKADVQLNLNAESAIRFITKEGKTLGLKDLKTDANRFSELATNSDVLELLTTLNFNFDTFAPFTSISQAHSAYDNKAFFERLREYGIVITAINDYIFPITDIQSVFLKRSLRAHEFIIGIGYNLELIKLVAKRELNLKKRLEALRETLGQGSDREALDAWIEEVTANLNVTRKLLTLAIQSLHRNREQYQTAYEGLLAQDPQLQNNRIEQTILKLSLVGLQQEYIEKFRDNFKASILVLIIIIIALPLLALRLFFTLGFALASALGLTNNTASIILSIVELVLIIGIIKHLDPFYDGVIAAVIALFYKPVRVVETELITGNRRLLDLKAEENLVAFNAPSNEDRLMLEETNRILLAELEQNLLELEDNESQAEPTCIIDSLIRNSIFTSDLLFQPDEDGDYLDISARC